MFPYTNSSTTTTTTSLEGPFLHFPCPFLDDGLMSDLLSQHNHHNPPPDQERNGIGGAHKKRVKRDRHTKICTAQGLRDRRMRLSVKVARKFFDLQDMLDFDKASKTIDWLLVNSESAIQELAARTSRLGCTDNQFSVSSSASASVSEVTETYKETEVMKVITSTKPHQEVRKRKRTCYHKVVNVNPFARESRNNARARARERTREKIIQRSQSQNNDSNQLETSKNQDSVNGANHNHEFQGFAANEGRIEPAAAGCYAMTSKKTSLGNCVQVQNIIPNDPEHSCTLQPSNSVFMMTNSSNGGQYWNPSSIFGTTPNIGQEQQNPIPNSIFMNTMASAQEIGMITSPLFTPTNSNIGFHSHFHGNHFP